MSKIKNKKLFFSRIYLILGTVVILVMGSIVLANFFRDSAVFAKKRPAVAEASSSGNHVIKQTLTPDNHTATKYSDTVSDSPKVSPTPSLLITPSPSKKMSVEVVNYTKIKKLSESVKSLLEEKGFAVSAGNGDAVGRVATTIIDRTSTNAGEEVRKAIKAGKVIKKYGEVSRFDVTVILGDDYAP